MERRVPLKRKAAIKKLRELKAHVGLKPSPIKPVNRERKAKRKEAGEVYGPYHRAVANLPCILDHLLQCEGVGGRRSIEGHHLRTVGAGGKDKGNEVSLCPKHHDEVENIGRHTFERKYGLSLKQEAQAIEARISP